jgi:DNA-directed RNA polymerase subunit RPC12/RpoP
MMIAFSCPECQQELQVNNHLAGLSYRCGACSSRITVPEAAGAPDYRSPAADRPGRPAAPYSPRPAGETSAEDRPWMPSQIAAICFVFGAGAGGAAAGINFTRLGKPRYLVPSILLGSLAFLLMVLVGVFLVRGDAWRLVGLLMNAGVSLGFLLAQKPYFDAWKVANWTSAGGKAYRPGRIGQLFLIGFGCLALEAGVVLLLVLLGAGA